MSTLPSLDEESPASSRHRFARPDRTTPPCWPALSKPAVNDGLPMPVGPSQPAPAVHGTAAGQPPSEPEVMSFSAVACAYGKDAGFVPVAGVLASAYTPAMTSAEIAVPPASSQPAVV